MNKTELVAKLAEKSELSKKDCEKVLAAFVETVEDSCKAGEQVQLIGFGTFSAPIRPARTARSPKDGKTISVPEKRVVKFKVGKAFADMVK